METGLWTPRLTYLDLSVRLVVPLVLLLAERVLPGPRNAPQVGAVLVHGVHLSVQVVLAAPGGLAPLEADAVRRHHEVVLGRNLIKGRREAIH